MAKTYEFQLDVYGNTEVGSYTIHSDSENGAVEHAIELFEKEYPNQEVVDVDVFAQYDLE